MPTTISTLAQTVVIDGVSDIVVTTIEQDPTVGDYVREIRIFGFAVPPSGNAPLVMTLRMRATQRDTLEISIPASDF